MHALDAIFRPQSVAVIGASSKDRTIGKEIVRNLIAYEFQGPIFPVNPQAKVVHSIKCYKSVMEIPDPVDLAIIVVPSKFVLQVAEECGQKGIKGLVVITAGFKEIGETGLEREKQLFSVLLKYGMRMIGPNCMGVINTNPAIKLDATFAPTQPIPGNIGFMSQSGALGVAILEIARDLNLGISMFASMGNKTDISGNDLL
ncbi:CoA-binding protein, partial [bacterium]|nr:CoA-binding protein [bacterium]